jgi:hypothetical protein
MAAALEEVVAAEKEDDGNEEEEKEVEEEEEDCMASNMPGKRRNSAGISLRHRDGGGERAAGLRAAAAAGVGRRGCVCPEEAAEGVEDGRVCLAVAAADAVDAVDAVDVVEGGTALLAVVAMFALFGVFFGGGGVTDRITEESSTKGTFVAEEEGRSEASLSPSMASSCSMVRATLRPAECSQTMAMTAASTCGKSGRICATAAADSAILIFVIISQL